MRIILRLFAVLLMSTFAINGYSQALATSSNDVTMPMTTTSAFSTMYGVQSINTQSLSMYGAQEQVMYGSYTIPMAAQSITSGTTLADQESYHTRARRVIQDGDGELKPTDKLDDPSLQPIGEVPLLLLVLLAALVTYLRVHKPVDYLRVHKQIEAKDN